MAFYGGGFEYYYYALSNVRHDAFNYEVPTGSSANVQIALETFIEKKSLECGSASFVKPLRVWGSVKHDGKYRSVQLDGPVKKEEIASVALAIQQYLEPDSNAKVSENMDKDDKHKIVIHVATTDYKPTTIASIVPKEWKVKS